MSGIADLLAPGSSPSAIQERLLAALVAAGDRGASQDDLRRAMGTRVSGVRVHVSHTRRLLADHVAIVPTGDGRYVLQTTRSAALPPQRKGTRWSPELDALLARGAKDGLSFEEIATKVGRTPAACEGRAARLGLNYAVNAARSERRFRDRWERSSSVTEVAVTMRIPASTAAAMAKRMGLPTLPMGEVRAMPVPGRPKGMTPEQVLWARMHPEHPEAGLILLHHAEGPQIGRRAWS